MSDGPDQDVDRPGAGDVALTVVGAGCVDGRRPMTGRPSGLSMISRAATTTTSDIAQLDLPGTPERRLTADQPTRPHLPHQRRRTLSRIEEHDRDDAIGT